MKHIALPSGGVARVGDNIKPETVAALDEMVQAAARVKFPDDCRAIYRGNLITVIRRVRTAHGNETVLVERKYDGRKYTVAVKHLLTQAEYEQRMKSIEEAK